MDLYSAPFRPQRCVTASTCLPYEALTITRKCEHNYYECVVPKILCSYQQTRDINFESKHNAIYGHEENNPTYVFFNAKKPQQTNPNQSLEKNPAY